MRLLVLLGLAAILTGCGGLPVVTPAEEAWLLTTAALRDGDTTATGAEVTEESLLALTPQMERFAEAAVEGISNDAYKVRALLRAIVSPDQLGLQYDENATYNATGAFEHARANCLGFTALFIAMARHVDLESAFNEVDVPPIWNMHRQDTLVLYRHVNAAVRVGTTRWQVVDVYPDEYDVSYPQRQISDEQAQAQYYNNLAMEHLIAKRSVAARQYLVKAISIAPGTSYLWGNLGATYRRAKRYDAAELAFLKAIDVEPNNYVALSNASRLYADTGRPELARPLAQRAARHQKRNPYYRYRQALDAMAKNQYVAAKKHALAAIHLYRKEHRFHFLLGAVYSELGEIKRARESFERAVELTFDSDQASRYRHKIDQLMSAKL